MNDADKDDFIRRTAEFNQIVKHPSQKDSPIPDDYRERSAYCVKTLLEPLRKLARMMGYCLVAHGTMVRDIDLLAVPWEKDACNPVLLATLIQQETEKLVGHALMRPGEDHWECIAGKPGHKPHGRLVWTFHLGGGPYLDLSVIPPGLRIE